MKRRRIVELRSTPPAGTSVVEQKNQNENFSSVPLQLSGAFRDIINYGKSRYALGLISAANSLANLPVDLEPFVDVTPDLDHFLIELKKSIANLRKEANTILTKIDDDY